MGDRKPPAPNGQGPSGEKGNSQGNQKQFLPGPSSSDAPDLLEEAYEYVKAQVGPSFAEESGFGDPLIGDNCDFGDTNFDILQYINGGNETPEGSPAAFCSGGPSGYHQQQQQLLGAAASELVQALQQQQVPLHKEPAGSFQQPILLDSVGLVMYNGATAVHHPGLAPAGHHFVANPGQQVRRARGQTRLLPDSPPITDISGAASSISPGSSGACDSASPYSPDQFRYVHQQQPLMNGGILIQQQHQQPPPEEMLLVNQMQLMGHGNGGGGHRAGGGGMLMRSGTLDSQLSPQSEFLSPYPPSQSTPGSQHSSQVSPPSISHQSRQPLSYILQNPPAHALSVAGSFASMDNLYTPGNEPMNGNGDMDMQQQQQHFREQPQQQHGHKRRRMSSSAAPGSHESLPLNANNNLPNVKSEIGAAVQQQQQQKHRADSGSSSSESGGGGGLLQQQQQHQSFEELDENMNTQRTIKFEPFMRESWASLYDANQQQLPIMPIVVVADKGFNYSSSDNCFVNQKKNHFQITVNISMNPTAAGSPVSQTSPQQISLNAGGTVSIHQGLDPFTPRYVRLQGRQELLPIINQEFLLAFCGVKSEMQTYEVPIKQSQTDRKPIDHSPVRFQLDGSQTSVKQTVPRLHFSETTMNNHRKNGKPNPEQKYFLLAVKFMANTALGPVLVQAFHSDRVIVRASNPGQFEQPEPDQAWKCQNGALTFSGPVCIGGDKPIGDAQLTVHGNVATTGQITRPSDRRVKENILDLSTTDALDRVAQMRLVEFAYKPEIAERWGLSEQDRHRVGVIAQELAEVLPEAVKDNGEFLTVDDTRIFYDTVAAAQELYRLTGNLECKIGQVEKISQKLARYAQKRRQLGSMASGLSDFSTFFGANPSAAMENKSYVSYSRTSLSTTGAGDEKQPPNERKKRGKDAGGGGGHDRSPRHRCRSYSSASAYNRSVYCHGPESATICSSKFTQGTIVTLVFIMALCLVTMCTLYVLDWYNRNYQSPYHHGQLVPVLPEGKLEQLPENWKMGEMIEIINSSWVPPDQNVPPLSVHCSPGPLASLVAGPLAPSCPQYCCAAENTYYERLGERLSQGVDSLVALASKLPHLFPSAVTGKLDEKSNEFGNGVGIEVLGLNMSLDGRYCLPENCGAATGRNVCLPNSCSARRGRFNLYVPVSVHLPTMPIQLQFNLDDPSLLVESCGNFSNYTHCSYLNGLHKEEDTLNGPRSNMVGENRFELNAASFIRSAFKFRVGHSIGLCQLDEKQRGRSFDEFNLVFYRSCQQQAEEKAVEQKQAAVGNATS